MRYHNALLDWTNRFYSFFIWLGSNLESLFILFLRLTWGHQFFLTGLGKLHHIQETTAYFTSLSILHPEFSAYLVGSLEMVCGFLLFIGLASRLAAIPLIVILLTALSTAHKENLSNFRFLTDPMTLVMQTPYPFLITSLVVFIFGPGRISVDAWIKRWVSRQRSY
jgi:putative oxidoreductase